MADVPAGMHSPRHANSMPQPSSTGQGSMPLGYPSNPPPQQALPKLPYPTEEFMPFPSSGPGSNFAPAQSQNAAQAFSAIPSALLHGGAHSRVHSASLSSKLPSMAPAPLNYRPSPKSWESAAQRDAAAIIRPASTSAAAPLPPSKAAAVTAAALMNGGHRTALSEMRIEDEAESPVLGRFTQFGSGAAQNSTGGIVRSGTPSTIVTNENGNVVDSRPIIRATASDTRVPRHIADLAVASHVTEEPTQLSVEKKAGRSRATSDVGSAFGVGGNPWASPPAVPSNPPKQAIYRKPTTKQARDRLARDLESHIAALANPMPPVPQAAVELPAHEFDPHDPDSPVLLGPEDRTTTNDERTLALLDLYFSTPDEEVKPKLVRSITKSIKKRARSSTDERSQLAMLVAQLRSPITDEEPFSASSDYSASRLDQWEDSLLPTAHPDGFVPNPLSVQSPPWSASTTSSISSESSLRSNRPKLSLKTTPSKLRPVTRSKRGAAAAIPPVPSLQPGLAREDTLQREYAGYKAQYSGDATTARKPSDAKATSVSNGPAVPRKATPEPVTIPRKPTPPAPAQKVEQFKPRPANRPPSYEGHGWYDENEWVASAVPAEPSPLAVPHRNPEFQTSASLHEPLQQVESLRTETVSAPAQQQFQPPPPQAPSVAPHQVFTRQNTDPPAFFAELPSREHVPDVLRAAAENEQEQRNARRREWEAARDAAREAEDGEIRAEIAAAKAAAVEERRMAKLERKAEQQARQERAHAGFMQGDGNPSDDSPNVLTAAQVAILAESDRRGSSGGGRFGTGASPAEQGRAGSFSQARSRSPDSYHAPAPLALTDAGIASPPLDSTGHSSDYGVISPPPSTTSSSSSRQRQGASPAAVAYLRMQGKTKPLSIGRAAAAPRTTGPTPPPSGGSSTSLNVPAAEGRHRAASNPGSAPMTAPLFQRMDDEEEAADVDYASPPASQYGGSDPGAASRGRATNPYARPSRYADSDAGYARPDANPYRRPRPSAADANASRLAPPGGAGDGGPNPYRANLPAHQAPPPYEPRAGHARSRSVGPPAKDAATIEREIAIATNKIEIARAQLRQKDAEDEEREKGRKSDRTRRGLAKLGFGSSAVEAVHAVGKILT